MSAIKMIQSLPRTYPNTFPPSKQPSAENRGGNHQPIQDGHILITPVLHDEKSSFGAKIDGIDWSRPLLADDIEKLKKIQDNYGVLIFRKTGLDNKRHIDFAKRLGQELEINPFFYGIENDRIGDPLLWDVSNINLDGTIVQPNQRRWDHSLGNALWHTDSSFHQHRSKYSLLLSHGSPARGGSWTHFADTARAYADLPQSKKDELEDLIIEHDLWHSRRLASPQAFAQPLENERAAEKSAYHRLVQVGPDGIKTLYLAAHAKLVVGRGVEESQKLIWELINHCTQSKYVFSMEWLEGGDMVWWDNRKSMHRANPYNTEMTARDVRRATVIDDGPLAFGVSEEEQLMGHERTD
ncbi:putative alpha-ketoglutarate-dependent 2,4-dichlorophenoxyacetate dioxygenase [Colletotrichum godetiae]|uniref:Alpha-ketoglutarate-dependent 2,4-dichlorophenoxyacetate dioxygenase n=1 Tax=Colletotrichum godetiae TaxID=1209918 RepID=A0AAJ0AMB3_9PEZI|nr:putative alpha-ketoglutarate-dependent 2,4-dichlorophenoxyacetate dioxygenase [Colletotrichum godetiae]KAK1675860.1 putative alpha-ketoglutarate-dependent 2,4-dichlorophenoxyacetate dioxygenase [Colletotrichum godetiae]